MAVSCAEVVSKFRREAATPAFKVLAMKFLLLILLMIIYFTKWYYGPLQDRIGPGHLFKP
jgi:hypothetical protein